MSVTHYIASLVLTNFRGFKSEGAIPLAPLTFLVGPNSSGKSSLFAAISLIAQSDINFGNPLFSSIVWSGRLVDTGSFSDVVFAHKANLTITIALEFSTSLQTFRPWRRPARKKPERLTPIRVSVQIRKGGKQQLGVVHKISVSDVVSAQHLDLVLTPARRRSPAKLTLSMLGQTHQIPGNLLGTDEYRSRVLTKTIKESIARAAGTMVSQAGWKRISHFVTSSWEIGVFLQSIQRVSSGRGGPQRWYPFRAQAPRTYPYDVQGRFDTVDPTLVETSRSVEAAARRSKRPKTVRLDTFLNSLDIASEVEAFRLSPYHSSIRVKDNLTRIISNLIDVGYGASQIIPVLIACQSPNLSPLLIEQPELHLHPRAQGEVA
jgi:hypothetical protein